MKRFILLAAMLFAPVLCWGQQTSIVATVTDPAGKAYQFLTGSASIQCPGNQQPSFNGSPLARTIPITGGDGFGTFTQVLWDVNAIQPAGCSWKFAITAGNGVTNFITGNIAGVTGAGPVDLSAAISAYSVLLPATGGGTGPALQTNNVVNPVQTLLNLKSGGSTTLTADGAGGVTISSSGSPGCFTTPNALQYNNAGALACANGITTPDGNSVNLKGPIPWVDATQYGMRTLAAFNPITVTTNGTTSVTTTGIGDFIKIDGIVIPAAGAATAQSTPAAPTVTQIGTTGGSATVNYKIVGVDAHYGLTVASAAGTVATVPAVFGAPATRISAIARSGNVVTVTTGTAMPFSSGTFQARITNVTGGSTQFSGLQTVTVTSGTTATYSQTGSNESGTVVAGSYIRFEAASFVVTTVQATAGSNQLVLTTSINHNIQFRSSGTRPVRIYLDGIQFSGATPPGYANGTFAVAAVTANTITVTTSYTSPITTTGVVNVSFATSGVAQMTATVLPVVDVVCPALAGTTKFYAVYADYGSGYAPVGFTPWGANILEDYGPAWTQSGLILPPGMALPATPPVAAQAQAYTGQITNVSGSTLTVTPSVTQSLTAVTALHDNSVAFTSALTASCANSQYAPVYLPAAIGAFGYYLFSAPLDVRTASGCGLANIVDGGPIWLNGTMNFSGMGTVEWTRPMDIAAWDVTSTGANSGAQVYIFGYAPTMMLSTIQAMTINGMQFNTLSNGQVGLEIETASNVEADNSAFLTSGINNLSSIPLFYFNAQFGTYLHNVTFSGDINTMYPVVQAGSNSQLGDVAYWPVPSIEITGAFQPKLKMDGKNYGVYRGIQFDNLYANTHTLPSAEISDVDTFQAPYQGIVTVYGSDVLEYLKMTRDIGDSVVNPIIACVTSDGAACAVNFSGEKNNGASSNIGSLSGAPFRYSVEIPSNGISPSQNTNEFFIGSSSGTQINGPSSGTNPGYQIACQGGTGNALNILDTTQASRTGITCPGGLLSIGGTTSSTGTVTQSNTGNRTYTFPDVTGNLPAFTITPTNTDCVFWSGIVGLQGDSGGPCSWHTITPVNGDCVTWSGTAGAQGDSGASCGGGGGGMATNMSNMATPTAMNTGLTCTAANTCFVGTQAIPMTQVAIGTVANQAGTFNTANLTANRVINWPNATSSPVRDCPAVANQFLTVIAVATGICTQAQPTLANIAAGVAGSGTFDFSGVTLFKARVGAGLTTTINGDFGYDTTNKNWHAWQNAADNIVGVWDGTQVNGDCVKALIASSVVNLSDLGVCVTSTSTNTFTNKTYNAESTGNALSEPVRAYFQAAGCNNSTAGNVWDIGTTNAPTPQCTGSTVRKGVLQFAHGNIGYLNWHLPKDWNSSAATDLEIGFTTTDTTVGHTIIWDIQTGCTTGTIGGATDDPVLNAQQQLTITISAGQVVGGYGSLIYGGITMTGCAADSAFEIQIKRDAADTVTDTAVAVKFAEVTTGVTKNASNR